MRGPKGLTTVVYLRGTDVSPIALQKVERVNEYTREASSPSRVLSLLLLLPPSPFYSCGLCRIVVIPVVIYQYNKNQPY